MDFLQMVACAGRKFNLELEAQRNQKHKKNTKVHTKDKKMKLKPKSSEIIY